MMMSTINLFLKRTTTTSQSHWQLFSSEKKKISFGYLEKTNDTDDYDDKKHHIIWMGKYDNNNDNHVMSCFVLSCIGHIWNDNR